MKEENWALPVMQTLILDLRNFARRGDKRSGGKPGERQEKAAETMMSAFRVCVADTRAKTDDTKRWGMLFVVNQLFKVNEMYLRRTIYILYNLYLKILDIFRSWKITFAETSGSRNRFV